MIVYFTENDSTKNDNCNVNNFQTILKSKQIKLIFKMHCYAMWFSLCGIVNPKVKDIKLL